MRGGGGGALGSFPLEMLAVIIFHRFAGNFLIFLFALKWFENKCKLCLNFYLKRPKIALARGREGREVRAPLCHGLFHLNFAGGHFGSVGPVKVGVLKLYF